MNKKVYVISAHNHILDDRHHYDLTDDEFMTASEEEGLVYSLEGFQKAFNECNVHTQSDFIRII